MPMIAFHGTADPDTPYDGGKAWITSQAFPNIPGFVASWGKRNRCAPEPAEATVTDDVSRRSYTGCANGADVVLFTVKGGGHTWPAGGRLPKWFVGSTTHSISASKEMWKFFEDHPVHSR